jgi:PKD repeat protein
MKKLTLTLLVALVGLTVFSQVPREMVIMEKGTGTWCGYCPGAAMGAEDLIENGCSVAVISYHSGDAFQNSYSSARISYYGITGFPTAEFDGLLEYVGGSGTQSMYPYYLPLYQQRIAIPSSFTIDMYGENIGSTYNVTLVLNKVAASSASNIKAHLVLTESNIPYAWQNQSEVDFAERLMVPDENGTAVDFTGNTEVTLNLQFTVDAAWTLSNLELVAFLQDNNTQECLQGTKVLLSNLEPLAATANFAASSQTPCQASSVQFTDLSGGEITSWNWTFEGGNPATSTLENPQVTYSTLGDYDVQLIVTDGETTDTLLNPNYITVITAPAQPGTPAGNTVLCELGPTEEYSIAPVPWAATYVWSVEPAAAGTITGIDPTATFTMAPGYLGSFQVKVRADNSCGQGTWSQGLTASIYNTPEEFTLSPGSGYCEGGQGIELTLDGSETGINYELYLDNVATGNILPGTGAALNFGYHTEQGIYTCQASTNTCERMMIGNSYVYIIYQPGTAATPTGPVTECNDNTAVAYTTAGTPNATSYNWSLQPAGAGTITGNTTSATVDWADTFTGLAQISVQGANNCGAGTYSANLQVDVNQAPAPVVSGDDNVCSGDYGIVYSTPATSGNSYQWAVAGGTVASGSGTNQITVNWGTFGTGYVHVTETTVDGCDVTSSDFVVTIEDCTGIGENLSGNLKIYPNPVRDELVVEINSKEIKAAELSILNQVGQKVSAQRIADGVTNLHLNIASLPAGVYSVRILAADGTSIDKKFVKVN